MRLLRLLLILAVALGLGPRFAAGGEVICGVNGFVAYDFERGAPAAPEPERCDHCTLAKAAPPPEAPALPGPRLAAEPAAEAAPAPPPARPVSLAARPRGPPLPA
ncbi:MAG: hypothetical protein ACE37J_07980 [Pikeienuella sp.]|uniref:hypothetical protein n=1 Tax=Pikeienuella sp. TaxID=2831957 RepID=UPI00391A31E5